jgi:hypothetical protein
MRDLKLFHMVHGRTDKLVLFHKISWVPRGSERNHKQSHHGHHEERRKGPGRAPFTEYSQVLLWNVLVFEEKKRTNHKVSGKSGSIQNVIPSLPYVKMRNSVTGKKGQRSNEVINQLAQRQPEILLYQISNRLVV